MPIIGSPLKCKASFNNNRINLQQYGATIPAAGANLLDVLVSPSSAVKSFRVSSVNLTTSATTVLRLGATRASTLTVTNVDIITGIITTNAAHGLATGNFLTLGGTAAPAGTALNTPYFVRVLTATTFALYTSASTAVGDTARINLTLAGSSVTIATTGIQLSRLNLASNQNLQSTSALEGSFLFQLPAGASFSAWSDVALEFFRFTLYEV